MMFLLYLWAALAWAAAVYLIEPDFGRGRTFLMALLWPLVPLAAVVIFAAGHQDFQCLKSNGV